MRGSERDEAQLIVNSRVRGEGNNEVLRIREAKEVNRDQMCWYHMTDFELVKGCDGHIFCAFTSLS